MLHSHDVSSDPFKAHAIKVISSIVIKTFGDNYNVR